jgi:arginyl-tRNA synthetase
MHILLLTVLSMFLANALPYAYGLRCVRHNLGKRTVLKMSSLMNHSTQEVLNERVRLALVEAFGDVGKVADTMVLPTKPEFGDYQCNAALPLAKKMGQKPREVAEKLMNTFALKDVISEMDITGSCYLFDLLLFSLIYLLVHSGPGFINLKLSSDYLKNKVNHMLIDSSRVGIAKVGNPKRIIVDFSSPNIAKEMHVGHLRSTIIGDSLSNILQFLGHDVLRLNHVGDWGTQFGMLIHYLNTNKKMSAANDSDDVGVAIGDLVEFYKAAKKKFDEDSDFQEAARKEVVKLQSNDPETILAWKKICDLSRREFQKIYDILHIEGLNERGESFYNPMLPNIVSELEEKGLLVESEGAKCIFLPGYTNPDGTPQPLIVKKTDGGYLYATTDLAAVKHRSAVEKAQRVLYVTDVGQAQHFEMVFKAAKEAKLCCNHGFSTELVHVPFGLVQGEDGKKFKTRSGDTVKLIDLLDESVRIASEDMLLRAQQVDNSVKQLSDDEKNAAKIVGIAAVKYADLSMNRESNYRFSYKKMLSLNGNTAPYMLYAYVRIQGIKRKAVEGLSSKISDVEFTKKEEIALAKQLIKFDEVLKEIERELYPNKLCEYLYDLSSKFNQFYEQCPVLKASNAVEKSSRTSLCVLTADILQISLKLLGIDTVDKL